MRRRDAETLSKEMTKGGLPKIIKAHAGNNQGPLPVNVWQAITCNVQDFNYGGFILKDRAGFTEIVVPEPGIYIYTAQTSMSINSAGGDIFLASVINGIGGPTQQSIIGGAPDQSGTGNCSISGPLELAANDTVGLWAFNNIAASVLAGWTWHTLMKVGGRY